MTDVVYILGNGSPWQNNELRFSLRALQKFITDLGQIFIVGEKPAWLTNVVHLYYADKHVCKERNIMEKVAYCCGHPDLSQKFLHLHDDHFALAPGRASEIPNWCGPSLERMWKGLKDGNHWRLAVENTDKALQAKGHPTQNFDLHYPIIFDKTLYPEVMDEYNWKETERGFVVKSLYANTLHLDYVIKPDVKLNTAYKMAELVDHLRGRDWFSFGNGCLNSNFKKLLAEIYPEPSRYEI